MYCETIRNLTITDGILPISSSEETHLPWLKALAFAILKRQPFLNVSRGNGALYTFLLFVKNTFVCYGISYKLPKSVTLLVIALLFLSSMITPITSHYFDWILLLLYYILCVSSLPVPLRLMILVQSLTVIPISYQTHYSTEYCVDFFCVLNLTWYILDGHLEQSRIYLEIFFHAMMSYLLLLLMDVTMGTGGYLFEMVHICHMFFYLCIILDEHNLGNRVLDILLIGLFVFWALEKFRKLNTNTLFQNWEDMLTAANMNLFGDY